MADRVQSPDRQARAGETADPYDEARSILVQGPSATPRATIQAYSSFAARWKVVEARGLAHILDPRVLAAITLVQYAWPEIFESIFNYPELFFYLHALVRSVPNEICKATEIEELYDLGQPRGDHPEAVSQLPSLRRHADLARLFGALPPLPHGFDVNNLFTHLTLVRDDQATVGVHLVDPWAALASGDPVLVRFSARAAGEVQQDLRGILLAYLAELMDGVGRKNDAQAAYSETGTESTQRADRAIFALGRVGDEAFVEIVRDWLRTPSDLPNELLSRAIYALGHHAARPDSPSRLAASILAELLVNETVGSAVRIRVVRLLRYCAALSDEEIGGVLDLVKIGRRAQVNPALRAAAMDTILHAEWQSQALQLIDPTQYESEVAFALCSPKSNWPRRVWHYLVRLAGATPEKDPLGDKAWSLLAGYEDIPRAMHWLALVALMNDGRRRECTGLISDRQKAQAEWRAGAWHRLINKARQVDEDDEWNHLIVSLGNTEKGEAAETLGKLYPEKTDPRWKEHILRTLEQMRDRGVQEAEVQLQRLAEYDSH